MNTALKLALDIDRMIADAANSRRQLDISERSTELFLRFLDCGYSRPELAETLREEAAAAGISVH